MPTFRLNTRRRPTVPSVAAWLAERGAAVDPAPDGPGNWPDGTFRAYLPGISTRAVAIAIEGGRFTVAVPTLASTDDLGLAVGLIAHAGADAKIELDGATAVGPAALVARCDGAWAEHLVARDCAEVAARALRGVVTLPGPVRDTHIGPRLAGEMGADVAKWMALVRTIQYPQREGIVADAVTEWRRSERGSVSIVAMSRAGGPSLVPYAELVALQGDDEPVIVPFARLVALAGGRVRALDERNLRAEGFSRPEWDALVERARRYAVDDVEPEEVTGPPRAGFGALALVRATDDDTTDTSAGPAFLRTTATAAAAVEPTVIAPRSRGLAVGVAIALLAVAGVSAIGIVVVLAWWLG